MSTPSETSPAGSQAPSPYSLRRLERLVDTIFAVSLLFLLVTIDFAPEESASATEAYSFLWKNISQTMAFAIGFLIIAHYWLSHQEYFGYFTSTNKTHTLIELIFLMTIAAMPFNNHFIRAFPTQLAPRLAISSDIFVVGILGFLSWTYAVRNGLVNDKEVSPQIKTSIRRKALVMPILALVAAGAGVLHPYAWDAVLFIGPLLAMFLLKQHAKK